MVRKEVYMSEGMGDSSATSTIDNNGRKPHPSRNEPLEVRIRGLIEDQAYSTDLGRRMFGDARHILVDYFRESLANAGNPELIHDKTQEALKQLAGTTNARIVSGEDKLESLPKGAPIFALVNHYSGYKLMDIEQSDFGVDFEGMDYVVPFPFFYSSLIPAAEKLGDNLYDAHLAMPDVFGRIQEESGLLVIPTENNAYVDIKRKTKEIIDKTPNALIAIFPEGESSGKRNNGGPYDLVKFHGGSIAIAYELGIPVIPICQYFNPESGFEVGILDSIRFDNVPESSDKDARKEYFAGKAEEARSKMQSWLDQRKATA